VYQGRLIEIAITKLGFAGGPGESSNENPDQAAPGSAPVSRYFQTDPVATNDRWTERVADIDIKKCGGAHHLTAGLKTATE